MFLMLVTVINIIQRTVPEFLGLSFIGIILLKFMLMYLIRMKLNFEVVPHYKFHFIIPIKESPKNSGTVLWIILITVTSIKNIKLKNK
jgi:hypothetical protein